MSGRLWGIVQKHLDDYGVREGAEFARRIGTSPPAVSSWLRTLQDERFLVEVSDVTRRSYDQVFEAVPGHPLPTEGGAKR